MHEKKIFKKIFFRGCNGGSNHIATVSKPGQFRSRHVASVHSAVLMSAWLKTAVDAYEIVGFAQQFQRG